MRAGLWRWGLALIFAGFVLHAALCPCEVAHPRHPHTKPALAARLSSDLAHHIAARAPGHTDAAPPTVTLLADRHFIPSAPTIATFRLITWIVTPLAARGPPPSPSTRPPSGTR